ncbi:MAG: hypothetical protein KKB21_03190 [Nanoarchaeota archaeon]|nr:hypothetical protein [Nanoarchaeota archaeon]MBU4086556.1 hypothetical protein [Nanoarchaeota archaeon]
MAFTDRTGNLSDIKTRIVSLVKIRGPILPIHVYQETKITLLLASAFLSDLVSEKTLKISNLKVGGSPLYFLPGQENMLENFEKHLPGKEREAFALIKEKKILKDGEQEPAIRIALRNIKDFAIPYTINFQGSNSLFWQHHAVSEEEAKKLISDILEKNTPKPEEKVEEKTAEKIIEVEEKVEEKTAEAIKPEKKPIEPIFTQETIQETPKRQKQPPFLEQVKNSLASKNIEFLGVEKLAKKEAFIRIKQDGKETLLLALDKKKVDDSDILKAWKKSQILNLPYQILAKGEPSKKLKEAIESHKSLEKIDKF